MPIRLASGGRPRYNVPIHARRVRMGLDFAIDELYASGWTALNSSGCEHHTGRFFPSVSRCQDEFRSAGFDLSLKHIQLFDCFRAEWRDASGQPIGAVVGHSEAEAAVYGLARFRRQMSLAGAP